MNYALIFAGGTGTRMNSKTKPKQFLELHGKAIIIHTLEIFENHPEIDGISVVCIESWLDYLKKLIDKGYTKQILVTNDICLKSMLHKYGGWGYDHVLTNIVPMMEDEGISSSDIRKMLVENPADWLCGKE